MLPPPASTFTYREGGGLNYSLALTLLISLGVLALGGIKVVGREGKVYQKRIKVCTGWLQVYVPDMYQTQHLHNKRTEKIRKVQLF